jgi:hypothetical protein
MAGIAPGLKSAPIVDQPPQASAVQSVPGPFVPQTPSTHYPAPALPQKLRATCSAPTLRHHVCSYVTAHHASAPHGVATPNPPKLSQLNRNHPPLNPPRDFTPSVPPGKRGMQLAKRKNLPLTESKKFSQFLGVSVVGFWAGHSSKVILSAVSCSSSNTSIRSCTRPPPPLALVVRFSLRSSLTTQPHPRVTDLSHVVG